MELKQGFQTLGPLLYPLGHVIFSDIFAPKK